MVLQLLDAWNYWQWAYQYDSYNYHQYIPCGQLYLALDACKTTYIIYRRQLSPLHHTLAG